MAFGALVSSALERILETQAGFFRVLVTRPLVGLYGGCMVVLKVSRCGVILETQAALDARLATLEGQIAEQHVGWTQVNL